MKRQQDFLRNFQINFAFYSYLRLETKYLLVQFFIRHGGGEVEHVRENYFGGFSISSKDETLHLSIK